MPWDCAACGATALLDDTSACPGCGGGKAAWTMHANKTRTMRMTRKEKLELLRGTDATRPARDAGYAPDVELVAAQRAVSLPKEMARELLEQKLLPAPTTVLVARLHPRPGQDPTVTTSALFEVAEVVPAQHPQEPLQAAGSLDVWFLLVHGPGSTDGLDFPGLIVLDVTEETDAGHAPQLGVAALAAKRKDLPIEPAGEAHIHAKLLRAPSGEVAGPAKLAWRRDLEPVTEADLPGATLPATVGEDGVVRADWLPWGSWTVEATLDDGSVELEPVAVPLQRERDEEPQLLWLRTRVSFIFARLLRAPDGVVAGPGRLSWQKDGGDITQAELGGGALLPEAVGDDGVLNADGLPWGSYTVQVRLDDGQALEPVAIPLQQERVDEPQDVWLRLQPDDCCGQPASEDEAAEPDAEPDERGHIRARLLRAPDGSVVGPATLAWEKDGAPVTQAELGADAILPTSVDASGLIEASALPWGAYTVRATPAGSGALPLTPLPLLGEATEEPHLQWVRA
jgi:hypothetical protein